MERMLKEMFPSSSFVSDLTSSSSSSSIGLESVRLWVLFLFFFVAPNQPTFPYSFSSFYSPGSPTVSYPEKRERIEIPRFCFPRLSLGQRRGI